MSGSESYWLDDDEEFESLASDCLSTTPTTSTTLTAQEKEEPGQLARANYSKAYNEGQLNAQTVAAAETRRLHTLLDAERRTAETLRERISALERERSTHEHDVGAANTHLRELEQELDAARLELETERRERRDERDDLRGRLKREETRRKIVEGERDAEREAKRMALLSCDDEKAMGKLASLETQNLVKEVATLRVQLRDAQEALDGLRQAASLKAPAVTRERSPSRPPPSVLATVSPNVPTTPKKASQLSQRSTASPKSPDGLSSSLHRSMKSAQHTSLADLSQQIHTMGSQLTTLATENASLKYTCDELLAQRARDHEYWRRFKAADEKKREGKRKRREERRAHGGAAAGVVDMADERGAGPTPDASALSEDEPVCKRVRGSSTTLAGDDLLAAGSPREVHIAAAPRAPAPLVAGDREPTSPLVGAMLSMPQSRPSSKPVADCSPSAVQRPATSTEPTATQGPSKHLGMTGMPPTQHVGQLRAAAHEPVRAATPRQVVPLARVPSLTTPACVTPWLGAPSKTPTAATPRASVAEHDAIDTPIATTSRSGSRLIRDRGALPLKSKLGTLVAGADGQLLSRKPTQLAREPTMVDCGDTDGVTPSKGAAGDFSTPTAGDVSRSRSLKRDASYLDFEGLTPAQKAQRKKEIARMPAAERRDLYSVYKGKGRYTAPEDLVLDDYEIDPAKNDGVPYAYDAVRRGQAERRKMHGGDCECCRDPDTQYWEAVGPVPRYNAAPLWRDEPAEEVEPDHELAEHKDRTSRHREDWRRPPTPPDFWKIGFPDTQEVFEMNERAKQMETEREAKRRREVAQRDSKWKKRS